MKGKFLLLIGIIVQVNFSPLAVQGQLLNKPLKEYFKKGPQKDQVQTTFQNQNDTIKVKKPVFAFLQKKKNDTILKTKTLVLKNEKPIDTANTKKSFKEHMDQMAQCFAKNWNHAIVNFSDNQGSLFGGINFSKQNVNPNSYSSPFNYNLTQINNNLYKPGFTVGYRLDGRYKKQHAYSLGLSINKYAAGANYQSSGSMSPFIGSFSSFKADEQFLTLGLMAHYKQLLPVLDTAKFRLYVVLGPNLETRIVNQSLDNQVANAYHKVLLRGDLGLAFDNQGYYTIYFYYHHPLTSFTNQPIQTKFTSFELGMQFKTKDIF